MVAINELKSNYVDTRLAAQVMKVSPRTLDNMRSSRVGPPYIKSRGRILYSMADIVKYLEERKIYPEG